MIYTFCLQCGKIVTGSFCPKCNPEAAESETRKRTVAQLVEHLGRRQIEKTEYLQ